MDATEMVEAMTKMFEPDAKLIDLERRLQLIEAETERFSEALGEADDHDLKEDPRIQVALNAARMAINEIISTPAQTARGVLVKARMMRAEVEGGPTVHAEALVESLIADLERMVAPA